MDVLDSLNLEQKQTLASFQSITSTDDLENAIEILNASDWNLELAITKIYDRETGITPSSSEETRPLIHPFAIDDTNVTSTTSTRPNRNNSSSSLNRSIVGNNVGLGFWLRKVFVLPINLLIYPFGFLYSATSFLFNFIARILRLHPTSLSLRPRNPFARDPTKRLDPSSASERWIRNLEELTGGIRYSRRFEELNEGRGEGSSSIGVGVASGSGGSGSISGSGNGIGRRGSNGEGGGVNGRKVLPDFFVGGYEDAVKKAKEEIKILMVVLTCEEHENDEVFKNTTLTDPELIKTLNQQDIIIWGGDIRDRDCYQASRTLQYLSLPFIAFICLQPPTATPSSPFSLPPLSPSTTPKMSIISRLEGSPLTSTSSNTIQTNLMNLVLPRVTSFLGRLRGEKRVREGERKLREEQDLAYVRSAERDESRVLKKRMEVKIEKEIKLKEEKEKIRIEKLKKESFEWRKFNRFQLKLNELENDIKGGEEMCRIGIRLGDGRRVIRKFNFKNETVEDLYKFVECSLERQEEELFLTSWEQEKEGNRVQSSPPPNSYTQIYLFNLFTTHPHSLISPTPLSTLIGEINNGILIGGCNLVIEGLEKRRESFTGSRRRGEGESSEDEEE